MTRIYALILACVLHVFAPATAKLKPKIDNLMTAYRLFSQIPLYPILPIPPDDHSRFSLVTPDISLAWPCAENSLSVLHKSKI